MNKVMVPKRIQLWRKSRKAYPSDRKSIRPLETKGDSKTTSNMAAHALGIVAKAFALWCLGVPAATNESA